MIGLVIAGPWLTGQAARLFGRLASGSSALLASQRLADNPKRAFRAVTGLTLAVFLGTDGRPDRAGRERDRADAHGRGAQQHPDRPGRRCPRRRASSLSAGSAPSPAPRCYPLYKRRRARTRLGPSRAAARKAYHSASAVSCADMRAIGGLGQCAPGLQAVQVRDDSIFDDNPIYDDKPIVSSTSPAYTGNLTTLPLQTVLVKVNSPATLERVRTYLAVHAPPQVGGDSGNSPTPPRTFGETLQIRTARAALFERILYAAVALTLIVAGCSLAVSAGGGLVDRKRPFTLLRVSGTPVSVLSRVVLLRGGGSAGGRRRGRGRHRLRRRL